MSRCRITRPAQADLREIRAYIAEHAGPRAAARWIEKLRVRCHSLADAPGTGRARDELAPGLRSVPVGNYLIFFRQVSGGVDIVHVYHGARDLERLLREE
jgi:toxin ParE1/3/4